LKSWLSVQAAIVLTGTTRFPDLLVGLKQLKLPRLFVAIIGLMWRYLAVIVDEVTRMLRARSSRSAAVHGGRRVGGSLGWRARVTGGMAGSLFLRSLERSDRVYAAMLSRGYNGEPPVMEHSPLKASDLKTLVLGNSVLLLLFILGLLTGG
jgi:cobalt/nickel transport system permease protein